MTKLCPRGKAAAKRKFKVYPSAYANAYASRICAGKIKDPSGVKRKDFKGRKPSAMGGRIMAAKGFPDLSGDGKITQKDILMGRGVIPREKKNKGGVARGCGAISRDRKKVTKMYV